MIYEDIQIKNIVLHASLLRLCKNIEKIFKPREICLDQSKQDQFETAIEIVFCDISFLRQRIETTISNIDGLCKLTTSLNIDLAKFKETMEELLYKLNEYENERKIFLETWKEDILTEKEFDLLKFIIESEMRQRGLLSLFERFSFDENQICEMVMEIWKEDLADSNIYKEGEPYKFLVYATDQSARRVYERLFYKPLIYTSLISDENTCTYLDRGYGLIYRPQKDNLLYMSGGDNYTVDLSIDYDSIRFSIMNNYVSNGNGLVEIQQNNIKTSRTYLMEQISSESYNEVVLLNNSDSFPCAVFLFNDCTEWEKENARELSKLLNLRLITLSR